jgi:hypothetical protein
MSQFLHDHPGKLSGFSIFKLVTEFLSFKISAAGTLHNSKTELDIRLQASFYYYLLHDLKFPL